MMKRARHLLTKKLSILLLVIPLVRIRSIFAIIPLLLFFIISTACDLTSDKEGKRPATAQREQLVGLETLPIATVNGHEVSVGRFNKLYKNRISRLRWPEGELPAALALKIKTSLAMELINELLVHKAARQRGIKVSTTEVNKAIQQLSDTFPSQKEFQRYLTSFPGGWQRLQEMTQTRIYKELLVGIKDLEPVSDDEALKFYNENLQLFNIPPHLTVQDIIFLIKPGDPPEKHNEQKEKAKRVLTEAQKPQARFSLLARRYSEGHTAKVGGYLGRVTNDSIDNRLWGELTKMKPNQVSGIIQTADGYHILKLVARKPGVQKEFDQVKEPIKKMIRARQKSEKIAILIDNLRSQAKIENHLSARYEN